MFTVIVRLNTFGILLNEPNIHSKLQWQEATNTFAMGMCKGDDRKESLYQHGYYGWSEHRLFVFHSEVLVFRVH